MSATQSSSGRWSCIPSIRYGHFLNLCSDQVVLTPFLRLRFTKRSCRCNKRQNLSSIVSSESTDQDYGKKNEEDRTVEVATTICWDSKITGWSFCFFLFQLTLSHPSCIMKLLFDCQQQPIGNHHISNTTMDTTISF